MRQKSLKVRLKQHAALYLFILVPLVWLIIYDYYPILLQTVMSFQKFNLASVAEAGGNIWGNAWIGLENYKNLFSSDQFVRLIGNTITISVLRLLCGFAPPIILAIMLFDMRSSKFRKVSQTILYIPHFFSWVVMYAIVYAMFSSGGYINSVMGALGLPKTAFLMQTSSFYPLLIGTGIWKEVGWGTIIYMAALSNIDMELFDAAKVDGAGPISRIIHITIPGILPIVVFLLTLQVGSLLNNAGMEQILLFYSPANYSVSDVIDTWVYRVGMGQLNYDMAAALSQFKSVIGLVLILLCNKLAIKISGRGMW